MDLKELRSGLDSLLAVGNRLANSTSIMMHGNLRSLDHMVNQTDAAINDWNSIHLACTFLLQRIDDEIKNNSGVDSDCKSSCSGHDSGTQLCSQKCATCERAEKDESSGDIPSEAEISIHEDGQSHTDHYPSTNSYGHCILSL